jgi:hypothetical protein
MTIQDGELTDEVWAQLDAGADRLPRRRTMLVALAGLLVAVLTGGSVLAWHELITPRLRLAGWSMTGGGASPSGTPTTWEYTYSMEIANDGPTLTIAAMGRSFPGVTLVEARLMAVTEADPATGYHPLPWPVTLHHGQTARFDLVYRGTGCARGPLAADIPVTLNRRWGTQHGHVDVNFDRNWARTVPAPGCPT